MAHDASFSQAAHHVREHIRQRFGDGLVEPVFGVTFIG
jgi:hypothetical protein